MPYISVLPVSGQGIGGQFRGGHRPRGGVCPYVPCQSVRHGQYDIEGRGTARDGKVGWALYRAGVDALIVQDMALLELDLPPIPLHASTQMDNRTPEKVKFLHSLGFSQVVLARELSLAEIQAVHEACDVPLEVFVHGALCVSYSGQCYVSQHCFGRSANRGECAQFCRLKFDMVDSDGRMIEQGRHLLSLKDMNRGEDLERLLDAGVTSLKIEGRLKDVAYVKNVTAWYRSRLDEIFKRRPSTAGLHRGRSLWRSHPVWRKVLTEDSPVIFWMAVHLIFFRSIRPNRWVKKGDGERSPWKCIVVSESSRLPTVTDCAFGRAGQLAGISREPCGSQ